MRGSAAIVMPGKSVGDHSNMLYVFPGETWPLSYWDPWLSFRTHQGSGGNYYIPMLLPRRDNSGLIRSNR